MRGLHRAGPTWTSVQPLLAAGFLLLAAHAASAQAGSSPFPARAGDGTIDAVRPISDRSAASAEEVDRLRAQLAAQQAQIDELRALLHAQTTLVEGMLHVTTAAPPAVRLQPAAAVSVPGGSDPAPVPATVVAAAPSRAGGGQADEGKPAPLSWRIGATDITPIGFVDLTAIMRDGNVGSGIATNFAAIPFGNTVNGQLRDYRFSAQNSRLGLRLDSKPHGMNVLGYLETDFQGLVPGNVAVVSNSDTQRLRLFWI